MIDLPPEPPPSQEQVIEQRLLDCGLTVGGFSVKYEDYLQSIEVVISSEAGVTPDDFACIHEAVFPEIVTFADGTMYQSYMAFLDELFRPGLMAEAEAELKKRGLWEGFPRREAYADLADFARALEAHAGYKPSTLLRATGDDRIILDPPREVMFSSAQVEDYTKLIAVILFASSRDRFGLGFIGNEKFRDEGSGTPARGPE